MDAGNLLKPMLTEGELHCIGTTTLDEYRKYIEKDATGIKKGIFKPVLARPSECGGHNIHIKRDKEKFEIHHGVRITDNAIIACIVLSSKYISDEILPDKAIDLMDEAASMIRTEIDSMPTELDAISRKIMQMEIEQQALKKADTSSKTRLEDLQKKS